MNISSQYEFVCAFTSIGSSRQREFMHFKNGGIQTLSLHFSCLTELWKCTLCNLIFIYNFALLNTRTHVSADEYMVFAIVFIGLELALDMTDFVPLPRFLIEFNFVAIKLK